MKPHRKAAGSTDGNERRHEASIEGQQLAGTVAPADRQVEQVPSTESWL